MKRVAVSQRIDVIKDRGETRDALDQQLNAFLVKCGYLPIPVPNFFSRDEVMKWLNALSPDAIILSGGNDIGDYPSRDWTETALLDFSYQRKLPLLGICRGMQMIAHWAGVGVKKVIGHVATKHILHGKITNEVNSYHSYSIIRCPDQFEVLAQSEDGEIEAIRHFTSAWEGWMWHPEREAKFANADVKRLQELFDA